MRRRFRLNFSLKVIPRDGALPFTLLLNALNLSTILLKRVEDVQLNASNYSFDLFQSCTVFASIHGSCSGLGASFTEAPNVLFRFAFSLGFGNLCLVRGFCCLS